MPEIEIRTSWEEYHLMASVTEDEYIASITMRFRTQLRSHYRQVKKMADKLPYILGVAQLMTGEWFDVERRSQ